MRKSNGSVTKKDLKDTEERINRKFGQDLKDTEERINRKFGQDLKDTEERINRRFDKKLTDTETRLNKRIDGVIKYIDFKLEPIMEFKNEFSEFKNKIFDKLDWLIGKYQKFEDELAVKWEHDRRIEERVERLEKKVFAS